MSVVSSFSGVDFAPVSVGMVVVFVDWAGAVPFFEFLRAFVGLCQTGLLFVVVAIYLHDLIG